MAGVPGGLPDSPQTIVDRLVTAVANEDILFVLLELDYLRAHAGSYINTPHSTTGSTALQTAFQLASTSRLVYIIRILLLTGASPANVDAPRRNSPTSAAGPRVRNLVATEIIRVWEMWCDDHEDFLECTQLISQSLEAAEGWLHDHDLEPPGLVDELAFDHRPGVVDQGLQPLVSNTPRPPPISPPLTIDLTATDAAATYSRTIISDRVTPDDRPCDRNYPMLYLSQLPSGTTRQELSRVLWYSVTVRKISMSRDFQHNPEVFIEFDFGRNDVAQTLRRAVDCLSPKGLWGREAKITVLHDARQRREVWAGRRRSSPSPPPRASTSDDARSTPHASPSTPPSTPFHVQDIYDGHPPSLRVKFINIRPNVSKAEFSEFLGTIVPLASFRNVILHAVQWQRALTIAFVDFTVLKDAQYVVSKYQKGACSLCWDGGSPLAVLAPSHRIAISNLPPHLRNRRALKAALHQDGHDLHFTYYSNGPHYVAIVSFNNGRELNRLDHFLRASPRPLGTAKWDLFESLANYTRRLASKREREREEYSYGRSAGTSNDRRNDPDEEEERRYRNRSPPFSGDRSERSTYEAMDGQYSSFRR